MIIFHALVLLNFLRILWKISEFHILKKFPLNMSFVSKSRVELTFNFAYLLFDMGFSSLMSALLNFQKFFPDCIWEEDSKMQEIGEWSPQENGKMLTFLKYSWILFEIKVLSSLRCMNPEKWLFVKVYRFKLELRILQISTRLFCSNTWKSFEKFFFSKRVYHLMPPDLVQRINWNPLQVLFFVRI